MSVSLRKERVVAQGSHAAEFGCGDECRHFGTDSSVIVHAVGAQERTGWYWVCTSLGEFYWARGCNLELAR